MRLSGAIRWATSWVVGGRQAGADVEELPDTGLLGQVTDGPPEQAPILHCHDPDGREELGDLVAGLPVGREVVLAAEQVVVAPSGVATEVSRG